MLLVLDVGNTETVLGIFDSENLVYHGRLSSRVNRTADESWILLKMMFSERGIDILSITAAVISSVVPSVTRMFRDMITAYLRINPLEVSSSVNTGLTFIYENPASIGADRICNAVAGFSKYGGPVAILDFGTATTFDVVSEKGEYLGGVISLGLRGISHELHRIAAKLPRVDLSFPRSVIGTSTEGAMQAGIMWGSVSMIDGILTRIQQELGTSSLAVVATGGMAGTISDKSAMIGAVEPCLVLEGMRIIYSRNT